MLLLLTHPLYSGVPNYISGRISQFPELLARSHMLWVARTQQGTVFELTPTCIHCLGVQLGPAIPWMCPPCLQHTAIAEGIWCSALAASCCISHLADLPAVCQGPVVTTLCVSEWPQPQFAWCDTRGKHPTGSCWASLPFGEADRAEQSRAEHSTAEILPCSVLRRWRDLETLHSVLCFLLPWIPLDPFCPRSHRQIRALRKLVPASICKKGPFSSPSASCFVEDGWWMHLPCPILYSIHLTLSFIPSQTK